MTLLEEYFVRIVEVNLAAPVSADNIDAMLNISMATARTMVEMVERHQAARSIKARAEEISPTKPSKSPVKLSLPEATTISALLRDPASRFLSEPIVVSLRDVGLLEVRALDRGGAELHVSDAGRMALILGTGLRDIAGDPPADGDDVLIFGFINGVWAWAISSPDNRSYRLGYRHPKGIGYGWATFWAPLPAIPEWAKSEKCP